MPDGPAASLVGRHLRQYEVVALVGEGGMGRVFLARDTKLGRRVALKLLPADLSDDVAGMERFRLEARALSALNHPNILTIYDVDEAGGIAFIAAEYVEGETLRRRMRRGALTVRESLHIALQVAEALAAAHQAGIVHRDVKPENVMVRPDGYVKLLDFGLAKTVPLDVTGGDARTTAAVTGPGMVVGTMAYMSPEQAMGRPIDARSDVFSFGVVLSEMLTGRHPFSGASDLDTVHALVHRAIEPLPLTVPTPLRVLIERTVHKDPASRVQSMQEVVGVLRTLRDGLPSDPRSGVDLPRWFPRRLVPTVAVVTVALALGAVALWRRPMSEPGRREYVQLTNVDSATHPALSSDGRLLAFVHGSESNVAFMGTPSEIFVKVLPDGDPIQLTHDAIPNKFAPRFSPDGSRLAYSTLGDSGWTTWIVPVVGGQEPRRFLANAEGLTWIAPDRLGAAELRVLFSYLTGQGITMAVASSTESRADERTIFRGDGVMDHFSYVSPDRRNVLLAEMGFNGWQPCRVAPFDGSSKGRKVGPQPAQCTAGAWSPDGRWLYMSADAGRGFHIWRQAFPDGVPEQVTSGPSEEEGLDVAPDGRSIVTSIGTRESTVWIHDGRGDRQVASDAFTFYPTFSADGAHLYYLVRDAIGAPDDDGSLWVADVRSAERRRLLPEFRMHHFTISRDERYVAFAVTRSAVRGGVWVAALDGATPPRRVASLQALQAFLTIDGEIFFAAQEKDGTFVYRVNQNGSGFRKALPSAVFVLYGVTPDGRHLVVWEQGPSTNQGNVATMYPVDGGAPTVLCARDCAFRTDGSAPQLVSWSPDAKFLYLALMGGTAVFAVPLPQGAMLPPWPPGGLQSIEDAAALPGARPFAASGAFPGPNPSTYAYQKYTAHRNIYSVPVP